MEKLKPTIKKTTPSFEDMINQGYSANQNISLPIQGNISESVMPNNSPPIFQNASMYMLPEENIPASDYDFLSNILSPKTNQRPITQPTIEEDEDTGRGGIGIGQALAQSLAMLGAGVRGGDVGQVGRAFDLNRQEAFRQGQYQKQKAEQKQKIKEQENTARQYVDPNSEISIQERAKAEELYPFPIPKNLSYADINNKNVIQALQSKYNATQEQKSLEEQKGLQSRLDDPKSPETLRLKNSLKLLGINVPEGLSYNEIKENRSKLEKLSEPKPMGGGGGIRGGGIRQEKPEKEKKNPFQKEITEVDNRATMTIDALDQLKENVEKYGTYNVIGPQNNIRNQLVTSIAADYNKVKDPNSTVRGEEAKAVADNLGLTMFSSKESAIASIEAFKKLVQKQKNTSISKYENLPSQAIFDDSDRFIIQEYRNNPNDPKIKETYNNMLESKGMSGF
jgi:hypothetical protein